MIEQPTRRRPGVAGLGRRKTRRSDGPYLVTAQDVIEPRGAAHDVGFGDGGGS